MWINGLDQIRGEIRRAFQDCGQSGDLPRGTFSVASFGKLVMKN